MTEKSATTFIFKVFVNGGHVTISNVNIIVNLGRILICHFNLKYRLHKTCKESSINDVTQCWMSRYDFSPKVFAVSSQNKIKTPRPPPGPFHLRSFDGCDNRVKDPACTRWILVNITCYTNLLCNISATASAASKNLHTSNVVKGDPKIIILLLFQG